LTFWNNEIEFFGKTIAIEINSLNKCTHFNKFFHSILVLEVPCMI